MFLDSLMRRNPELINAAVSLHQQGCIPANSYVVDLDAVTANAQTMAQEAQRVSLTLFAMTKQFGRNPAVMDAVAAGGIKSFVAVDTACVDAIQRAGHELGNVGHLVQVPQGQSSVVAGAHPRYWTVFNEEKAKRAGDEAVAAGRVQDLLLRIQRPGDRFPTGLEGGFLFDELRSTCRTLSLHRGCRVRGVTSFPTAVYDPHANAVTTTPNLATLTAAVERLTGWGLGEMEINAPGTTSTAVLSMLADAGATQVEPGHGLTGTTPLHAVEQLPELPAMLYLSEVSHLHGGYAYCFGGGLYIDPVIGRYPITALVGSGADQAFSQRLPALLPDPAAIDFYGRLERDPSSSVAVGASVVFGFRAQAFATRSHIVPLAGVHSGEATVRGVWSADGRAAGGGLTADCGR